MAAYQKFFSLVVDGFEGSLSPIELKNQTENEINNFILTDPSILLKREDETDEELEQRKISMFKMQERLKRAYFKFYKVKYIAEKPINQNYEFE